MISSSCVRDALIADLASICQARGTVRRSVALDAISSWRVGGTADVIVSPGSVDEALAVVQYLHRTAVPWLAIGYTTNLLFADEGVRAVIVQLADRLSNMTGERQRVVAEAGIWVPHFARNVGRMGLSGVEHTIGIPGTLGGLVCMNGGSMRRGIGEYLTSALCVSRTSELMELNHQQCDFSYRRSRIQEQSLLVLEASFAFPRGDARQIRTSMRTILRQRRQKFPRKLPNCGSVFVSDPSMYATFGPPGAVIERLGLKGFSIGGAEISTRHANFIINRSKASAHDILCVIHHIRRRAQSQLNCNLQCEVRYVHADGAITPAHAVHVKPDEEPILKGG